MNNSNYLRGSEWRKWDLHVQPINNNFLSEPGNHEAQIKQAIEEYINKAIENNLQVIAITDHNTGYAIDQSLNYVKKQSLKITILPGVELDSNSGEHIIVIFNDDYKEKCKLATWDEVVKTFLQTVCHIEPPFFDNGVAKKVSITTEDLIKRVNDEDIGIIIFTHCLSDDGFFKRCGDANRRQNICKNFLNGKFRFIFEIKEFNQKDEVINKLKNWFKENDTRLFPIISSSDAHNASNVGKYFTWIKADPTFEGLKQILYEPEERVFIGDEPELLKRVRENKTKFIKSIKITQNDGYDENKGVWFKNIEIPLNPGLVSIIGNKGSGKSAIADIVGLCGNSHRYDDFSFLRAERFLKDNLASNFKATLEWEDGSSIQKNLNEGIDKNSPERVRYLPQNFFEKLANNIETYEFEKTLEEIVFSCIPEEQRLGKNTFAELIEYKKESIERDINKIKNDITVLNKQIIEIENKLYPCYKEQIKNNLEVRKKELEEHEKIKPEEFQDPSKDQNLTEQQKSLIEKQKNLNDAIAAIQKEIKDSQEKIKKLNIDIEELQKIKSELIEFKTQLENYINNNEGKFASYGLQIKEIISYKIDIDAINKKYEEYQSQINTLNNDLKEKIKKYEEVNKELKAIKNQLSEPQKKYQKYIEELKEWEKKKNEIEGDESKAGTIKYLKKELEYIEKFANEELTSLRNKRLEKSIQIFNKKKEIITIYESLKNSVAEKIGNFKDYLGDYQINIETSLKLRSEFFDEFLRFINRRVKGSFYGIEEGKFLLKKLIEAKNFNNEADAKSFLQDIIDYLENDKRDGYNNEQRYIKDQILKEEQWSNFYEYLFSLNYLDISYELKLGNKHITQLSPGERGALLIVFYLLLDKDDIPLIIDQPEENLDNESIFKVLTYFIRYTKKKRQLIIVTHNPNLAIVGDAEQLIYVNIDKNAKNTFRFESGSIENPTTNKHASDILEGTLKAFDIRRLKYLRV